MNPKQQADELAMKCAEAMNGPCRCGDCRERIKDNAEIIASVLKLEQLLECVEALRKISRADDAAIEELKKFYPGVEVRTELAQSAKSALAALDTKGEQ